MKAVELTEFETSSAIPLSVDEVQTLRKTAPSISIVPSGPGRFELTPGSEVGVIHLGDTVLRIRPKLPIDRVLFLISYALDPLRWGDHLVHFAAEAGLVEAIVPAFVEHVRRAMSRGVLCGYRTIEDALQTVRGALLFAAQLRRWYGRSPPAEVSFEEFTEDVDENRLLKAALFRLGRISIRSERTRRSVRTFDTVLGLSRWSSSIPDGCRRYATHDSISTIDLPWSWPSSCSGPSPWSFPQDLLRAGRSWST